MAAIQMYACILCMSMLGCMMQGSVAGMHTKVWLGEGTPTSRRSEHDLRSMQCTFSIRHAIQGTST